MGKQDVKHCKSNSHLAQAKALKAQPKLTFGTQSTEDLKQIEAEVLDGCFDC